MNSVQKTVATVALKQEAIRAKCFHPTGAFVEFKKEEIEQSISNRFEQIVAKYPDRLAVKTLTHALTYDSLNKAANRIAWAILNELGNKIEPVILLADQRARTIISCLAILKAGKILVALDPSVPIERLDYVLCDSQATAILAGNKSLSIATSLAIHTRHVINIDALDRNLPDENLKLHLSSMAAAEVRYSSGSTGQPKGIIRSHRRVLYSARLRINTAHICPDDRLLILRNLSFGGKDIFRGLLSGAGVFPFDIKKDGLSSLANFIRQQEITYYTSVPSTFRYLVGELSEAENFPSLRMVELGGEPLSRREVESYKRHCPDHGILLHKFSSGEAGNLCYYFMDKQTEINGSVMPVGFPAEGKEVFVVDENGEKVGVDQVGEVAVRSRYLSSGYWRKPELTNSKFLPDPSAEDKRVYLTGDLGRMLPDGCLIYLGRKDDQVKIRGAKVSPTEVEMVLRENPNVKDGAVMAWDSEVGEKFLAAYVVPKLAQALTRGELRNWLKQKLPDYMIPTAFVFMDALPRTSTGKVDRRSLQAPERTHSVLEKHFAAPRDSLELQLTTVWEEVLNIRPIGVRDNFFDLGGHSLLATRLCSRIEKTFGKTVLLATLFQAPTVEQMACILRQRDRAADQSCLVVIQPSRQKPPIFCVHPIGGSVHWYYDLAYHLGPDQPFYGLQAQGLDGRQPLHNQVEDMAAHYVHEMRTLQPRGPYLLGGLSFGGLVAFEMARQLHAAGQEIVVVALFDTHAPGYSKFSIDNLPSLRWCERLYQRVHRNLENLKKLESRGKLVYVSERVRNICLGIEETTKRRVKNGMCKIGYQCYRALKVPLPSALRDFNAIHRQLGREYKKKTYRDLMQVYGGRVALFRAMEQRPVINPEPTMGWGRLVTGRLEVHDVPGNHNTLIREPHVQILAEKLRTCLSEAQTLSQHKRIFSSNTRTGITQIPQSDDNKLNQFRSEPTKSNNPS